MPLCPLLDSPVEANCYSRNIEVGGMLIFEPATLVIHLIALIMTAIMIFHIKSKYTAVGRKEIVLFFYMYAVSVILEFFLISGIILTSLVAYKWFVTIYIGWNMATLWCLLLNGFVGFQWAEDGTPTSLWVSLSLVDYKPFTYPSLILSLDKTTYFLVYSLKLVAHWGCLHVHRCRHF